MPGLHSENFYCLFKGIMQNIVQWLPLAVLLYSREINSALDDASLVFLNLSTLQVMHQTQH